MIQAVDGASFTADDIRRQTANKTHPRILQKKLQMEIGIRTKVLSHKPGVGGHMTAWTGHMTLDG